MSNQEEFKQTEIRRMPKHWEVVRLGDKISLEYGKGLTEAQRKNGRYPVFGSNGIVGYHNDFLAEGPGIVVGRKGTIGAINWSKDNFWPIDTTYFVKVIGNDIDLRWLYYKLNSLTLSKLNMATGTPGLNRDLAYSQVIPLPPLPEQKKIAEVLSTVDQAIEKVNEAIKKTQRLKNGLMQELLTKGIGHKEFKETEIGRIPKEWELVKLSNVFKLASGKSRPKEISEIHTQKMAVPVYGGNGILGYTNRFMIDNETIVIGRVGEYCGSIHKTQKSSWVTDNALYALAIEKHKVNLDFLTYYLAFINLNKFKKESGQPLMTQTIVYSISCPLPPLPEQQKIAEILSTVDERLELLRKRKGRLKRTKKGLMNDLLTGRKRVRLEV